MQRVTRGAGLVGATGALVVGFGLIAGCSAAVEGTPRPNDVQAEEYAAEVTSSAAAASSSRAAAQVDQACSTLFDQAAAAVDPYNAFIEAANQEAPDVDEKAAVAVEAYRDAADSARDDAGDVPPELAALFDDYVSIYSDLADAVESGKKGDFLNVLSDRGYDVKNAIAAEC
ncbi:MAG: hypothetical protein GX610_16520 [Rhodococcus sp.]|nr:hypothetical protein [Rhodococcus sp. (in: high G+C Gram-positive bacteria)]